MRDFFEGLLHRAAVAGTKPALVSPNGAISYRELTERVRGHAQWTMRLPQRVGLLFTKGPDYIICDLALSFAGKELVPLPEFFSDAQLLHIAQAAQLTHVVADSASAERAMQTRIYRASVGCRECDQHCGGNRRKQNHLHFRDDRQAERRMFIGEAIANQRGCAC